MMINSLITDTAHYTTVLNLAARQRMREMPAAECLPGSDRVICSKKTFFYTYDTKCLRWLLLLRVR